MSTDTPSETTDRPAAPDTDRQFGSEDGILVTDGLVKRFGGLTAVDDLSFAVGEGEILGFIGPNGAGKSTTFNCIFGTYGPTDGTVYFKGEEVTGRPAHEMVRLGMARTFQEFAPLEDRPIVDNVALAFMSGKLLSFAGLRGETRAKAIEVCERVGLEEQMYQLPGEVPHAGMLKLELARAIATDPDLLLIDEPFAGLSSGELGEISDILRELRDEGMTLVVVDHNMHGLLDLIDRGIVINFGSLLAEGTPEEIKNDPQVQEAYLGGEMS